MRVTRKNKFSMPIVQGKGEEINVLDNIEAYKKKNKRIREKAKKANSIKPVESLQSVFSLENGVKIRSQRFVLSQLNKVKKASGKDEITF